MTKGVRISAFYPDGKLIGTYESINQAIRKLYILKKDGPTMSEMCSIKKNGERRLFFARQLKTDVYFKPASIDQPVIKKHGRYTFKQNK